MKIFSTHRRKIDANRRYRGPEFQNKVKNAANYKRIFNYNPAKWYKGLGGWFTAKGALWRTIGVLSVVALFYFMVLSSTLSVVNVSVTGNHSISTETIIEEIKIQGNSRAFFVRKNNFFLMTQGRVNRALQTRFPEIKTVETKRNWPNSISVKVVERNPGFVILSGNQYYLVDDEGTVVKVVATTENLLLLENQLSEDFKAGEMMNTKFAPFVGSVARFWNEKISSPIVNGRFPGKASSEVEFVTAMGWSVIFDTNRPAAGQLENLNLLLSRQVTAKDLPRLAYVDLRLTKWAYYCFKATPCEQEALPEPEEGIENEEVQ
jgi:cell division septal protein FtsQ